MKTQELLELAALDALGLLDDAEREAFDLAFRAAPPALQAQVRREQTRIAGDDSLLPKVEAPLGLKARVLAAWRDAVGTVTEHRGTKRSAAALSLARSRGISPLWRAGAIGCAAASVVLAVSMFNIRGEFATLDRVSKDISRQEYFAKEFGARFEQMFTSPRTMHVKFEPSASEVKAEAVLLIDPSTGTGHLYARQLPPAPGGYALVALDENGVPIRDEHGELKTLCVLETSGVEGGAAYNDRIKIAPGESVGLIRADYEQSKSSLLLRSSNI